MVDARLDHGVDFNLRSRRPPFRCRRRGYELGHLGECGLEPRIGEGDVQLIWILPIAGRFNRVGDALEQKLFALGIGEESEIDRCEREIEDSQHLVRIGVEPCLPEGGGNWINVQPLKDHPAEKTPTRTYFETAADALRNHSEELTGGSGRCAGDSGYTFILKLSVERPEVNNQVDFPVEGISKLLLHFDRVCCVLLLGRDPTANPIPGESCVEQRLPSDQPLQGLWRNNPIYRDSVRP